MSVRAYIFSIAAALFVLLVVVSLLRQRKLRERHAIWWLAAGALALLAGAFPESLTWAARATGIELPVNLVFFVSITILFLVSLQHSAELTRLESKTRDLAETVALLELRVGELGGETADCADRGEPRHDGGSGAER
ncbi:DUF2304 domain-containing protein [Demequina sp. TTPB684]|uniref:DUF2304 domain-containing protein n=1 Tax=unclassified Demequina TaxID=2620311 RepID=UPI001CF5EA46|nr:MULTISPECIES: DUF2304 domain-containing protein [unclassified Demequina]MCB2413628.1 DUF2304 domain-containing protein [Demequina sp. TTPB684]UPU88249.1 DUF2304 domain-containing protein [Demequina sp. TMPB413]